jgi:hypothetical protein
MKPKRCRACGAGTIRPARAKGRTQSYRGILLPIPEHIAIPTCDSCGAEWINRAVARAIDAALEEGYQRELRDRFDRAIARLRSHGITLGTLERVMRLSQGYLSKLRSPRAGRKLSATLVSHLMLLAKEPRRVREAEELWSRCPEAALGE